MDERRVHQSVPHSDGYSQGGGGGGNGSGAFGVGGVGVGGGVGGGGGEAEAVTPPRSHVRKGGEMIDIPNR